MQVLDCNETGIHLPMMALVDYCGFRVGRVGSGRWLSDNGAVINGEISGFGSAKFAGSAFMAKRNVVYDCGKKGVRAGFVSKEGTFFFYGVLRRRQA